jgi:hypothetical protein
MISRAIAIRIADGGATYSRSVWSGDAEGELRECVSTVP